MDDLIYCGILLICFLLIEYMLVIAIFKIIYVMHSMPNPNRKYHVMAFFGVLFTMVMVLLKFIDIIKTNLP